MGVDLIVAIIPSKLSVHPDYFYAAVPGEKRPTRAPADRMVSLATRHLLYRLLKNDVEVVDLHKAFADFRHEHGDDVPLFYTRDGHYVNRGARLSAVKIAERLRRYDFVREALKSNPYVGEKGSRNDGQKTDPHLLLIRDKNGGAYNDVASSPVAILGDSHLWYNGGRAQVSAQIAHLIGIPLALTWKEGLAREIPISLAQDPNLKKRKVVIIHYTERMMQYRKGKTPWPVINLPGSGSAGAPAGRKTASMGGRGPPRPFSL